MKLINVTGGEFAGATLEVKAMGREGAWIEQGEEVVQIPYEDFEEVKEEPEEKAAGSLFDRPDGHYQVFEPLPDYREKYVETLERELESLRNMIGRKNETIANYVNDLNKAEETIVKQFEENHGLKVELQRQMRFSANFREGMQEEERLFDLLDKAVEQSDDAASIKSRFYRYKDRMEKVTK